RRELEEPLARREVRGIVVIPAKFDADLHKRSVTPEVQVILDGADPNTAALVQGYVQGVINTWASVRAVEAGRALPGSGPEDRLGFHPGPWEPLLSRPRHRGRGDGAGRHAAHRAGGGSRVGARNDGGADGHAGDRGRASGGEGGALLFARARLDEPVRV